MNQPSVSIIVPVYNAETYLQECIQSILQQSYKNIELLLINDGSRDSSLSICKKYADIDVRIKVLNQKNAGVAAARNIGLSKAKGEYLSFIDADDFVEKEFLADLLQEAIKTHSDFVHCGHNEFNETTQTNRSCSPARKTGTGASLIQELLKTQTPLPLWTCMIKKSIINEHSIQFTDGCKYGEDQEFIYKTLIHCNQVAPLDKFLYNYRINNESAMGKRTLNQLDFPEAMIRCLEYIGEVTPREQAITTLFLEHKIPSSILFSVHVMSNSGISAPIILKELKKRNLIQYVHQMKVRCFSPSSIRNLLWKTSPKRYLTMLDIHKKLRK